jgi:hypothetical protein
MIEEEGYDVTRAADVNVEAGFGHAAVGGGRWASSRERIDPTPAAS